MSKADYQEKYVTSDDGLKIYYRDYGSKMPGPPILMLHGLTRNSADFEDLCDHLKAKYRIIAPDMRGRGKSDYDPNWQNYHPRTYVTDVCTILDREELDKVIIIGTSLGGLMAMMLGAQQPERIKHIILNDIGPEIDPAGIERIKGYVQGTAPARDWDEAIARMKAINEDALPDLDAKSWERFTKRLHKLDKAGRPVPAYDPGIGQAFKQGATEPDTDMWAIFDALSAIPIHVLRGAQSDILSVKTVAEMQKRHPDFTATDIPNRGHAPLLNEAEAVGAIDRQLEAQAQACKRGHRTAQI